MEITASRGMHPHHMQQILHVGLADFAQRLETYNCLHSNRRLHGYVLFTDNAKLKLDAINNTLSSHLLSDDSPHATVKSNFQLRFSVVVWCVVLDDHVTGPFILDRRYTGEV
jgi:hypothetical protein